MNQIIADVLYKMIRTSQGNLHDIDHFLKVHAYAKLIGEKELSDEGSRQILEIAAILHDIACPLCREKYGSAPGGLQEIEGGPMAREFLAEFGLPASFVEQVVYLVEHHHTLEPVTRPEHRILLEADYLVNAEEEGHGPELRERMAKKIFRTGAGQELFDLLYSNGEPG